MKYLLTVFAFCIVTVANANQRIVLNPGSQVVIEAQSKTTVLCSGGEEFKHFFFCKKLRISDSDLFQIELYKFDRLTGISTYADRLGSYLSNAEADAVLRSDRRCQK